jgi:hypothetical protein
MIVKKGDLFIFYGHSEVIKGTVDSTFEKITYDLKNGVKVITPYIISTDGTTFNEKLCLQISSPIEPSFLRKLLKFIKTI